MVEVGQLVQRARPLDLVVEGEVVVEQQLQERMQLEEGQWALVALVRARSQWDVRSASQRVEVRSIWPRNLVGTALRPML